MAHAEKCPVCRGKGTIPDTSGSTTMNLEKTCHGCDGRGWVEVKDDFNPWLVYGTLPKRERKNPGGQ